MDSSLNLGKTLFRWRDYTPLPLIIILLFVAEPTALSATLGLLSIICGELIRLYSVSFIGSVSRTRSESTGEKIVDSGPFAYVRNPLYIGNFFIAVGVALYSGKLFMVILTVVLFVFQYYFIVQYEESLLEEKFGEAYKKYKQRVPAWIPHRWPKCEELPWPDDWQPALKSERRTLSAIVLVIVAQLLVGAYFK